MVDYISDLMSYNILKWNRELPILENYRSVPDPDAASKQEYIDFKKLIDSWGYIATDPKPNGSKQFEIELCYDSKRYRLGGDQMITGWLQNFGNDNDEGKYLKKRLEDGDERLKDFIENEFIQARYLPGNFIFWERRKGSVNQLRGGKALRDRIDLTLECLRRWCNGTPSNLDTAFNNAESYFVDVYKKSFKKFVEYNELYDFTEKKNDDYVVLDLSRSDLNPRNGEKNKVHFKDDESSFIAFPEYYERYLRNAIYVIYERSEKLKRFGIGC